MPIQTRKDTANKKATHQARRCQPSYEQFGNNPFLGVRKQNCCLSTRTPRVEGFYDSLLSGGTLIKIAAKGSKFLSKIHL